MNLQLLNFHKYYIIRKINKWVLLKLLDGSYLFGKLSLKKKLVSFIIFLVFTIVGVSYKEVWFPKVDQSKGMFQGSHIVSSESKGKEKENRIYTVQIAAVNSAKQANKLVLQLKKKKIEKLYVVKSRQRSGGHWYKLRVGRFSSKIKASEFANRLVADKTIKNYFIISMPQKLG